MFVVLSMYTEGPTLSFLLLEVSITFNTFLVVNQFKDLNVIQ